MKVQTVTPYRVSHLQRYGVTVRGNVTSVFCYDPDRCARNITDKGIVHTQISLTQPVCSRIQRGNMLHLPQSHPQTIH
jgi:hypothetical protein